MITKNKLLQLIEPHFKKSLVQGAYEVKRIKAKSLLTHSRFDLAFKLLYLEMIGKDVKFTKQIYKEHIWAFSFGKFTEPGNENKNSLERFIEEFHNTFEDIKANDFVSTKTLIPLSKNGSIANGAHRVASAIYLDKDVECVEIDTSDHTYDYKFFHSRMVSSQMLDVVATKFVEYADNVHIALIWPTAKGHDDKIDSNILNIIYKKEMLLTPNGAHNLISQVYYGEEWLGGVEDDFRGSEGKLVECFKSFAPVRVIAFQANSLDEVLKIKQKIREIFNIGKHSIHITDTKEEAIRLARIVFNDNSISFLNYSKPNKYISTHKKIDKFKEFIKKNQMNSFDLALDSGIILSAYGLRESSDIDYFVDNNDKIKYKDDKIDFHDDELKYHDIEKSELIYNPKNYFYFNDLKFISFAQIYKMKMNRGEEKDRNDCKMMEAMIERNVLKKLVSRWKQIFYYTKIRVKLSLIKLLKNIGIYEVAKKIVKG